MWLTSCQNDESCRENTTVLIQVDLYSYSTLNLKKTDSLTVKGIGTDSVLYLKKALSSIALPLHNTSNKTSFEVSINGLKDTLDIVHQNQDYLLDYNCGCLKNHTIDSVYFKGNAIDSISIIQNSVNNVQKENIRLFY